jgi:hypothetical protein
VPQLAAPLDGQGMESGSAPASHSRSREVLPAAPPAPRRRVPVIAGVAAALVIAGVIGFVGRTGSDPVPPGERVRAELPVAAPPPATSPVAPPAPPPPPAAPEPPRYVTVKVRVSPDAATITIDGAEVTGNPFSGKYAADGAIHKVSAAAPGCVPKVVAVEFTANVTLDLSLERVPRPVGRPIEIARPVRPPPRTPEHTEPPPPPRPEPVAAEPREPREPRDKESRTEPDVSPAGGTTPQRPIDRNDPYGGNP